MFCKDSLSYKIMDYIRKSIDDVPKYVKIFDECKILIEQGIKIAILKAIDTNADYIDKSGINGLFDIINNDRKQLNDKIVNDMDMKKKKRSAPFLPIRDYTENCRRRDKNSVEAIRKATKYYLHDNRKSIPIQNETYEILMKLEDYFNITNPLFDNITEQQQKIIISINEIIHYVIKKFIGDKTSDVLNDYGYTSKEEVDDDINALDYYIEDIELDDIINEVSDLANKRNILFDDEDISELSEMINHSGWLSKINKKEPEKIVEAKHIDFDEYSEENNEKKMKEIEKQNERVNRQRDQVDIKIDNIMKKYINYDDEDLSDILDGIDTDLAQEKEVEVEQENESKSHDNEKKPSEIDDKHYDLDYIGSLIGIENSPLTNSQIDYYLDHAGLMKKLKEFFNSHKTPEKKSKKTKTIKKSGAKEVHDSIHDFEKRLDKLMKGL